MASYPVENTLNPRAFIYGSCNADVLILQSDKTETKLRFYNNSLVASSLSNCYTLASSNEVFYFAKDADQISLFMMEEGIPQVKVPGRITANRLELFNRGDKKGIVLADTNFFSSTQFAGFGFIGGQLHYQLPSEANTHRFMAAADSYTSSEIACLQMSKTPTKIPQVGIGTTDPNPNYYLHVAGNVLVNGTITFNDSKYAYLDGSQRITLSQLPEKAVVLDTNNKINESVLPQTFNFQFLRSGKNVGIGTRIPLQKLHLKGTAYITDRIGVGVTNPVSRLHAVETAAGIPTMTLENATQGTTLRAYQGANLILDVTNGVGIGTSGVGTNMLKVQGNAEVTGSFTATTMNFSTFNVTNVMKTDQVLNGIIYENVIRNQIPVIFDQKVVVNTITTASGANVEFRNCGIYVQGNISHSGVIVALSDERVKSDIHRIDNALNRLEKIGGYTYNMRNVGKTAGVIAQEIAQVLPEAVSHNESDDMYTVSYNGVMAMLLECVKELHAEVKSIKKHMGI